LRPYNAALGAALRDNKVHLPPSAIDAAADKNSEGAAGSDSLLIQGVNALVVAAARDSMPREGSGAAARGFFVSAWAEHAVAAVAAASAAATSAAGLFWLAELIERTARAVANWQGFTLFHFSAQPEPFFSLKD